MKRELILTILFGLSALLSQGQYWQQRVEYNMSIDFDAENHQFIGDQELIYFNNSPDTLKRVYYHLYFNSFQPGSMMDIKAQNIKDSDSKLLKISHLSPEEIGYLHVMSLSQNGNTLKFEEQGTILMVTLDKPI
jgi:hypothetical protein